MAQIPLPPGTPAAPGPPLEGFSTSSQAAVEGFSVGGTIVRRVGPDLPGTGPTTTQLLGGSGAYGSLAGNDRIFSEHTGVYGESDQQGVFGATTAVGGTGVYGYVRTSGYAIRAEAKGGGTAISGRSLDNSGPAARFDGDVTIDTGDLTLATGSINLTTGDIILAGADCAEDFAAAPGDDFPPGIVVVIGEDGRLIPSTSGYDKTVAGIVSGAGSLKPGVILGRQRSSERKVPLALIGRVNCYVDANYSAIAIGDLLTTSATPGHAMKANDPTKAFGAVLGKALAPLHAGRQLLPVLVALQ